MRKLILASVAAVAMSGSIASAQGIILGSDENDTKLWINTWAGQTEDKEYERRHGSSSSTFSGRRSPGESIRGLFKNTQEVWINRSQDNMRGGESVSTTSSRKRSPGESVRGMYKNSQQVWIRR